MLQKFSLALLGTAFIFLNLKPATAVTMTVNAGPFSSYSDTKVISFDDGTATDPNGFATYSNITNNIVQGSVSGQYASPYNDTTRFLAISPVGSGVAGATGSVTINFKQAIDYFGFYAGSLDSYNFIDIYNGDTLLKTFSGSDVPTAIANGSWTSSQANIFINLVGGAGETFDKVVLRSNGIAFETDNHTYRVAPEPSDLLGLLAIGAIGSASFLKRQKQKV